MMDPTMSILWSEQFFGNGDGDVMIGPFQSIRTILGEPLVRNIGTGMLHYLHFLSLQNSRVHECQIRISTNIEKPINVNN